MKSKHPHGMVRFDLGRPQHNRSCRRRAAAKIYLPDFAPPPAAVPRRRHAVVPPAGPRVVPPLTSAPGG